MNTETQTLEALTQHALRQKTGKTLPVHQIAAALNTLNDALETVHITSSAEHIVANLENASHAVSCLLYTITTGAFPVGGNSLNALVKETTGLYGKINNCIAEYTEKQLPGQLLPLKSLLKTLAAANETLKQKENIAELYALIKPGLETVIHAKTMHYPRWIWWSSFASGYNSIHDVSSFRDLLVTLNFNTESFINWLLNNLMLEVETAQTEEQKHGMVLSLLRKYESPKHGSYAYLPAQSAVSRAVAWFLKQQLLRLTKIPVREEQVLKNSFTKLNTTLSVPQLALLTRLMVETKILNERNQSALLKNIATVISTSKAASISSESLQVNYYTPNQASKTIVKEYLMQMVRLLATY